MRLLSNTPPSEKFVGVTNSDLAFIGNYAMQSNYDGYQVWNVSNPTRPTLKTAYLCPASRSDVSIYQNLLFVSGESTSVRLDCGCAGSGERAGLNACSSPHTTGDHSAVRWISRVSPRRCAL